MEVQPYLVFDGRCEEALVEGGQVKMALSKTFFSKKFGMLADKFGVGWMVIVSSL